MSKRKPRSKRRSDEAKIATAIKCFNKGSGSGMRGL